jgi:Zn-dependent M28 family amino/carboxypeptidase
MNRPSIPLAIVVAVLVLSLFVSVQAAAPVVFEDYDPSFTDAHVATLSEMIGPRAAGTIHERRAAEYLAEQFTTYSYHVSIQPFPYNGAASQNVVATRPGLDPAYGTLYIGAHYDSVPDGPGANDNASGSAVLLELARLFSSESVSPTLTFIAFGAEEPGMVGSKALVQQLDGGDRLSALGMINLDCVGVGTQLRLATIWQADRARNERVLRVAQQQAAALGLQPITSIRGNSDHEPFAVAGIPSVVLFADTGGVACGPDYHQPTDTSDKLDPVLMDQIGQLAEATARELLGRAPYRPIYRVRFPLFAHGGQ